MNLVQPCRFPLVALCGMIATFVAPATTQVPVGSAVVGTFSGPITSGSSGLFLVPVAGGATTPITGLPPALQQTGGGSFQQGVSSVALRTEDGAIVVGTVAAANGPWQGAIELYLLYLKGSAVDPVRTRKILLGNTTSVGGAIVVPMPDGRILVTASDSAGALTSGPMANYLFAIVDVSKPTPSFTFLTTPAGTGVAGGLTVDPTGRIAYYTLTTTIGLPTRTAHVYRWDLVTGQSCEIATFPNRLAKGLTCDDDGTLYFGIHDLTNGAQDMHVLHPNGCNPASSIATRTSLPFASGGIALDRASGSYVAATIPMRGYPNTFWNSLATIDAGTGVATVIAAPPPAGWGFVAGVALNNAIESYGSRSDGQNHYWFENFPNLGGQPTIGSGSFSLTTLSAPGHSTMTALALSLGRGSMTVLGIEVLVDLGTVIVLPTIPSGLSVTYPIPVPNNSALRGCVLTAQSVHVEQSGRLAASRGLRIIVQ